MGFGVHQRSGRLWFYRLEMTLWKEEGYPPSVFLRSHFPVSVTYSNMNRTMKSVLDDLRNKNIEDRKAHGKWVPENGEIFASYKESFYNFLQKLQEEYTPDPVRTVKDILISGTSRITNALSGQDTNEKSTKRILAKVEALRAGLSDLKAAREEDPSIIEEESLKELEDALNVAEGYWKSKDSKRLQQYYNTTIRPLLQKYNFASAYYIYANRRRNQQSTSTDYTQEKHYKLKAEFGFAFSIFSMEEFFVNAVNIDAQVFKNILSVEGHTLSLPIGEGAEGQERFFINFFTNSFALVDSLSSLIESSKDKCLLSLVTECMKKFGASVLSIPVLIAAKPEALLKEEEIGGKKDKALRTLQDFMHEFPTLWKDRANEALNGKAFSSFIKKSSLMKGQKDLDPITEQDLPCYQAFLRYTFDLYLYQCGYTNNLRDVHYALQNFSKETLVKIMLTAPFASSWGVNRFLGDKDSTYMPAFGKGEKELSQEIFQSKNDSKFDKNKGMRTDAAALGRRTLNVTDDVKKIQLFTVPEPGVEGATK